MLVRPFKKLIAVVCPLLVFAYFFFSFSRKDAPGAQQLVHWLWKDSVVDGDNDPTDTQSTLRLPVESPQVSDDVGDDVVGNDDDDSHPLADGPDYREIFSLTTTNRKFFPMYFGDVQGYNPNIIPHPTKHDMWIVVAQHEQSREQIEVSGQLMCNAGFLNGVFVCDAAPAILPVEPSIKGVCEGDLAYFNFRFGPRDARMFFGHDAPYIVYGSQSQYTCLGIWLQDVRMLLQDFRLEQFTPAMLFKRATEVRRPPPVKGVEKNFFLFWDSEGKAYVHHDIAPNRVFAQLSFDGSVGEDLAPLAAAKDTVCMAKYMPAVGPEYESIHQATNSLAVTMCRRADPFCVPDDDNTFVMTIFHHKSYYDFHGVYEPYVMLFRRTAPFAVHAISQRPLWIHGRAALSPATGSLQYEGRPAEDYPKGHSEMFYMTSMSWKTHGQKYHGYIDDELFLAFGIEDSRAAAIDILAGDLLQDLGFCAH